MRHNLLVLSSLLALSGLLAAGLPQPAGAVSGDLEVLTRGANGDYGGEAWGISNDGRFVLSWTPSVWDPLEAPDDGIEDLYVLDRLLERWKWVSPPLSDADDRNAGLPGGSISPDGSTVAYTYFPTADERVLVVVDVATLAQQVYPAPDADSSFSSLSTDGRWVAYDRADPTCDCPVATLVDTETGQLTSLGGPNSQVGVIADDGSVVPVRSVDAAGTATWSVHEVATGATIPVSKPGGVDWNPARGLVTADGSTLVLGAFDGESFLVLAHDVASDTSTVLLDDLDGPPPVLNDLSSDGGLLTLTSPLPLVANDTNDRSDAYAYDVAAAQMVRVSTRADGGQSGDTVPQLGVFAAADARYVTFTSPARDLVAEELPPLFNIYVKGLGGPIPELAGTVDLLDGNPGRPDRLEVDTPADAAVAFSRARFSSGSAPYAVLSVVDDFADSLAGTVLAEGPMLLSSGGELSAPAARELRRVLPPGSTVYLLGGEAALSAGVEQTVADLGFQPRRLAGPTRVETAIAVADEALVRHGPTSVVGLARATAPADNPTAAWADSVAGGVLAAADAMPVLLTPTDSLHPAVAAWLDAHPEVTSTLVLGGPAAVADRVLDRAPGGFRLAGPTRAGTAVAVAARLLDGVTDPEYLVIDGFADDGWAYGLPAAGWAAATADGAAARPILLVGQTIPEETSAATTGACGVRDVDLLLVGSASVIADALGSALDAGDGAPCP